jgi:hypothetical protein
MPAIKPSIPTTSAIPSEANDDGDLLDACARGGQDVNHTTGEEIRQMRRDSAAHLSSTFTWQRMSIGRPKRSRTHAKARLSCFATELEKLLLSHIVEVEMKPQSPAC